MILNLTGQVKENEIIFENIPLYFSNNQNVRALYVGIEWSSPVNNIYGYISSSLIDQCPVNQNQELIRFHHNNGSNYTLQTPSNPAVYKVQCNSFFSSVFQLHLSKQHKIREIQLQLEIF